MLTLKCLISFNKRHGAFKGNINFQRNCSVEAETNDSIDVSVKVKGIEEI